MSSENREKAILKEIFRGNVPSFLRQLKPVYLKHRYGGKSYQGTIYVLPDYMAIGSDRDFLRIPMTPKTAQKIADRFGFVLPTRKLVNEIYRQSSVKLSPRPMPPGKLMTSNYYYGRHQKTIERQLRGRSRSQIVAGHKKDIVISNRLNRRPTRVAIYGWHRTIGRPIQPLSLVHGNSYADYSHGVRFVKNIMRVGKYKVYVKEALKHRGMSGLLSDEGVVWKSRLNTKEGFEHSYYKGLAAR